MSSLLTSFNAGVSGLKAAQAGLNTTAHNIANTSTSGYTRQRNIQTDTYYSTIKTTTSSSLQVGYGVTVATVQQIRDLFLDEQYRVEVGRESFYYTLYDTATEVEDILGEMEGVEFNDTLDSLMETIQTLSTNKELIANRELFIAEVEAFLETAQNAYSALKEYQLNLNSQISSQVTTINSIADQIAELNEKIAKVEASGLENANDYRDARNLLMDELAEYVNYTYYEDYTGQVTIQIDNAPLVDRNSAYHMVCEKATTTTYDEETGEYVTTTSPFYTVMWTGNGYGEVFDLSAGYSSDNNTDVGSLYAILLARGTGFGNYTEIPQDATSDELEEYNSTIATSILQLTEAEFDLLIHKVVTAINDAFCPNVEADLSGVTAYDEDGNIVTLSSSAKVLDAKNCPAGADDDYTIGTEVFSRLGTSRYQILTVDGPVYVEDEDGNAVEVTVQNEDGEYLLYVYNEEDPEDEDTLYTLENLEINSVLLQDYSYLPVMNNPSSGSEGEYSYGDTDICSTILENWRTADAVLDPNTLTTYAVEGYYDAMVGNLATQANIWLNLTDTQVTLVENIESARQQVMGVSTEEEMVSLLMYQHAYSAASRYITVVDSMLEHLIEKLG